MSELETVDEQRTVKRAKLLGWKVYKVSFLGVNGAPDRLFGKGGRGVWIEFKRLGEEPTEQQYRRQDELRVDFGYEVYWTDNYADACAFLGIST